MDINYRRYTDALDSFKNKDKTFLHRWFWWGFNKFHKIYKSEDEQLRLATNHYYTSEVDRGVDPMRVVSSDEYKRIEDSLNPMKRHKLMYFLLVRIPMNVRSWLCCGWKLKYVPADGIRKAYWTWFDSYHMVTKLARYGSPMWPKYKFTWWDKLRFKWITGYEFEEVK